MNMSINRRLSPDQWVWMGGNWMVFWKSTSIKSGPSYAGFFLVTKGVFHGGTQQPWHSQECQEHCGLSKWITVQSGVIPQAALLPCMLASCRWARVNPTASDRWDSRPGHGGHFVVQELFLIHLILWSTVNSIQNTVKSFLIKNALNKTHWAI